MKGSEKKVSFSTCPFKSSASSKGSDENDRSDQEMGLNLENRKKDGAKNFMSPTVSAASKATIPRKKILAERNESARSNFPNTHLSKTQNLEFKASRKTTPKASRKNSPNLDAKVSPQKTPLSYNSRDETPSPRPYDPLINYLSPRPQFLRYNPGRRKQIFMRLQMTDKEEDDTLSVSSSSSFESNKAATDETGSFCSEDCSSSCGGEESGEEIGSLLEQEYEAFDIESDEESEEEVKWSMREGLKYLLVLLVLVLSTAYICSMNSPNPTQEFQRLLLGFQKIQNHSNGTVESVDVGYKFLVAKPEQVGFLGLNRSILDESIEEDMAEKIIKREILEREDRNLVESSEIVEEVQKDEIVEEVCEKKSVKTVDASDHFAEETTTVKKIEYVKENGETGDLIVEELVERKEAFARLVKHNKMETSETGEQIEDVQKVKVVKEIGESSAGIEDKPVRTNVIDRMVGDIELLGEEYAGMLVSKEDVQECLLIDGSQDVTKEPEELMKRGAGTDPMVGDPEIEQLGEEYAGMMISKEDVHQETASYATDSSEKQRVVVTDQMLSYTRLVGREYAELLLSNVWAFLFSDGSDHQETASHATDSSEKERALTHQMFRDAEKLGIKYAGVIVSKEAVQASLRSDESYHQETAFHTSEEEMGVIKETTHENLVQGKISEGGEKSGSLNVEEVNPPKGQNQQSGTDVLVKVLFGILACGTLVAYFLLGYNFRGLGMAFASKYFSLLDNHCTKALVKKKPSLLLPTQRTEQQEHLNNIPMNTMPFINYTDKDTEESYQRRAPSVELLGELEVGATSSSSKSNGFKGGMSSEMNSYSGFLEKDLRSKAYSIPAEVQVQQSFSGSTSVNPNSSEKLTPKNKLLSKVSANNDMAGLNGEGRNEVITPLRRSARIRNRAVTSP